MPPASRRAKQDLSDPALQDWRTHVASQFRYEPFLEDPAGWIETRLKEFPWSKQVEIVDSVSANRYTAVRSCHGVGKSYTAARVAAWWLSVHPVGSAFVVTSAPTAAQVEAILWREIKKAHEKGSLDGYITTGSVPMWKSNSGEIIGFGRKPADAAAEDGSGTVTAFQGIHAEYVLVVLDEACGIPEELWNAVDSLVTNEDSRVLAIGNPDDPSSHFKKVCEPGSGWNVIGISAFDSPAFTGEKVPEKLLKVLPSRTWVEERRRRWGADSPLYKSKVLGEFPEVSTDGLIHPRHVMEAQQRTVIPIDLPGSPVRRFFGLDVARFGTDRTVCYLNEGGRVRHRFDRAKTPTTQTAGLALQEQRMHPYRPTIRVDDTGVGGGVTDMLREQNAAVVPFNGANSATPNSVNKVRFANARAEWYWDVRLQFEEGILDLDPKDEELASQLLSIQYRLDRKGRIVIESKDEMKARGLPSPDRADAFVYATARVGDLAWLTDASSAASPYNEDAAADSGITGDLLNAGW